MACSYMHVKTSKNSTGQLAHVYVCIYVHMYIVYMYVHEFKNILC